MKKRTKISLRTKIYLTIVGLLALTGIIYSVNPNPLPKRVAASEETARMRSTFGGMPDERDPNADAERGQIQYNHNKRK